MVYIDTVTTDVSTFQYDSIKTSGQEVILCGNINDGEFGTVSSRSFFRMSLPTIPSGVNGSDNLYAFDSVTLVLHYNGYVYGDTTNVFTLNVYKLRQTLYLNENNYLSNKSYSNYQTSTKDLLGSKSIIPRPGSIPKIEIRLKDSFGKDIFNKMISGDDSITQSDAFSQYLKGLILSSSTTSMILGFKLESSEYPSIRIYYHLKSENTDVSSYASIYPNTSYQFNQISASRSGVLSNLSSGKALLNSSKTNNSAYMQCGTGLAVKIQFPYIKTLLEISRFYRVMSASLIVKPIAGTYVNPFSLPDTIYLSQTDGDNELGSYLVNSDNSTLTGNLGEIDYIHLYNNQFSYNITSYITTLLETEDVSNLGLIFISPKFQKTFERITIGDQKADPNYQIQLKIYYLKYDE